MLVPVQVRMRVALERWLHPVAAEYRFAYVAVFVVMSSSSSSSSSNKSNTR